MDIALSMHNSHTTFHIEGNNVKHHLKGRERKFQEQNITEIIVCRWETAGNNHIKNGIQINLQNMKEDIIKNTKGKIPICFQLTYDKLDLDVKICDMFSFFQLPCHLAGRIVCHERFIVFFWLKLQCHCAKVLCKHKKRSGLAFA